MNYRFFRKPSGNPTGRSPIAATRHAYCAGTLYYKPIPVQRNTSDLHRKKCDQLLGGVRAFLLLLLATLNASCFAALPFSINSGHPRVFLNSQRVSQIQTALTGSTALNNTSFPQTSGTIQFSIYPTFNQDVQSNICQYTYNNTLYKYICNGIFDDYDGTRNHVFFREVYDLLSSHPAGTTHYQAVLQSSSNVYVAVQDFDLTIGQWHTITISWNSLTHISSLIIDGQNKIFNWQTNPNTSSPYDWTPSDQSLVLAGRDIIDNLKIYNSDTPSSGLVANFPFDEGSGYATCDSVSGTICASLPSSSSWVTSTQGGTALQFYMPPNGTGLYIQSSPLKEAWLSTKGIADSYASTLNGGGSVIDVSIGHPDSIVNVASVLSMAYLITGNSTYSQAAFKFADQLTGVPINTDVGTEYSQAGRIEAMGILYDWLFNLADSIQQSSGLTYKVALSNAIRATLKAPAASGTTNSIEGLICGDPNAFGAGWSCNTTATSPAYLIGGHSIGDHYEVLAGVLAIIDENPDMSDLLNTLYDHYFNSSGIYASRNWINADGGSQMGWAYASGHTELYSNLLWQVGTNLSWNDVWPNKQFLRYVYGLRADHKFPASGDWFNFDYINYQYVPFFAWAKGSNDPDAAYASNFYKKIIRPNSSPANFSRVNELIFWQPSASNLPIENLPYSRFFTNAGQVLMRDSWDYTNATLLDFKSTSFWNENHHHLDQNAFTLYYKSPLLVDSGYYDWYGSSHWSNYFTRTIAHNTITIWDPSEVFSKYPPTNLSNDGGQQFIQSPDSPSYYYPLLQDIEPGGSNHLDGVTAFEYTYEYTYATANASKAYNPNKLDQTNGFIRSLVFLRAPTFWQKPVTIVFDKINASVGKGNLTKRFLLHSLNEPEPLGGIEIQPGIYQMNGNLITIRNGAGMLFSQTVLPTNPIITKIGGLSSAGDFRFMAPAPGSTNYLSGLAQYSTDPNNNPDPNYSCFITPDCDASKNIGDVGSWRLEIASPIPSGKEYFLHVISIADNDGYTTAPPSTQDFTSDNAAVVLLGNSQLVAFSKSDTPAANINWAMPTQPPAMLVAGLTPGVSFDGHIEASGDSVNPAKIVFQQSSNGMYTSSSQGTLNITSALPVWNADLSVTLSSSASVVTQGQAVTYTVQVINNGPGLATGVALSGLTGCNLPVTTLASGASTSCTATATANTVGTLAQNVSVTANQQDDNIANNSATASVTVQGVITVTTSGGGTVTSNPAGINCGSSCSASFNPNTAVTLAATPSNGYAFGIWTGCPGSNGATCAVNMTNNLTISASFVALPDLLEQTLSASISGTNFLINDMVNNSGIGAATAFDVNYYLSTNATYETSDTFMCKRSITSLAAGATNPTSGTTQSTCAIPSVAAGSYYILAKVDPGSTVVESNESNNLTSTTVSLIGVDLLPTAMSATTSGTNQVLVSETAKNQGGKSAGTFTVSYYLSTNTTYEASSDIALASRLNGTGTCNRSISLGANATSSVSNKTCYKPATAVAGTSYYVLVVDDATNAVVEYNEANNILSTSRTINW